MWKICDGLFLAQYAKIIGPNKKEFFEKNQIKKVITLTDEKISLSERIENIEYIFFQTYDCHDQDILETEILLKSVKIINDSIENGENVVVHCIVAVSRSVTICMGYLMYKSKFSRDEALDFIRKIRPNAGPNNGFMCQLKIFERNNCSLDPKCYKNVKLSIPNFYLEPFQLYRQPVDVKTNIVRFKCKNCRKIIFNIDNLEHGKEDENCQKYLIEPMSWLTISDQTCSITHSCGSKLGSFIASGSKCTNCSKFISPWINVDSSKIDRVEAL